MKLLVDTSVWSLAMRRDVPASEPQVQVLIDAIDGTSELYSTGIILQELLQGFFKPKAQDSIIERFASIPMLVPETSDYIKAAELRNRCRQKGIQAGTIDSLIAQLSLRYDLSLLTTDKDFTHMARVVNLKVI